MSGCCEHCGDVPCVCGTQCDPAPEPAMGTFRKKPLVISARRATEVEHIRTLEGTMTANRGDWIITGVKGEQYPCKDDIFCATYDAVDDAARKLLDPPVPDESDSLRTQIVTCHQSWVHEGRRRPVDKLYDLLARVAEAHAKKMAAGIWSHRSDGCGCTAGRGLCEGCIERLGAKFAELEGGAK